MKQSEHIQASSKSTKAGNLCVSTQVNIESLWREMRELAKKAFQKEEGLRRLLADVILDRQGLTQAIGVRLARKLAREDMTREELTPLVCDILQKNPEVVASAGNDLFAINARDPACENVLHPLLFFKGFMAITTYRVSHQLYNDGRREMAAYFQSLASEVFGVDIHPAAQIGCGILLDHATGFVAGETTIIEDGVSILHEVTLGGTGKSSGARHPIIRSGVLIGAGAKILGRVEIGKNAKVGAGSVVLTDVPEGCTVAGVPAEIVGVGVDITPALTMNQSLKCRIENAMGATNNKKK